MTTHEELEDAILEAMGEEYSVDCLEKLRLFIDAMTEDARRALFDALEPS